MLRCARKSSVLQEIFCRNGDGMAQSTNRALEWASGPTVKKKHFVDKAKVQKLLQGIHQLVLLALAEDGGQTSFQRMTTKYGELCLIAKPVAIEERTSLQRGYVRGKVERVRILIGGFDWCEVHDVTDPWLMQI